MGVKSILVERSSSGGDRASVTSPNGNAVPPHPRAHVLHTRSMEILRQLGLEMSVWNKVPPCHHWQCFRYCTSLTGETLAKIDHFKTDDFAVLRNASPCRVSQFSQPLLESILSEELQKENYEKGNCTVLHNHSFKSLRECGSGLIVTVSNNTKAGDVSNIKCSHLIAADGGYSDIRNHLQIQVKGERDLETFASIHFTSKDLGKFLIATENGAMLSFVFNDEIIAVVVAHDMRKGDWVIHVPFFPPIQTAQEFENIETAKQLIKSCIGTISSDEIEFELHSVKAWGMHATVAEKFSGVNEKVFLVGDAAHQFPPSGGFGVNAGLADAHNVATKIGLIKAGVLHSSSLAEYDHERRPVVNTAMKTALDNYKRGLIPAKILGLDRGRLATATSLLQTSGALATNLFSVDRDFIMDVEKKILDLALSFGKIHLKLLENKSNTLDKSTFFVSADTMAQKSKHALKQAIEERELALPLLFPLIDIGYTYSETSESDWVLTDPRAMPSPRIRNVLHPGSILPHVFVNDSEARSNISTLDLCSLEAKYCLIISKMDMLKAYEELRRELESSKVTAPVNVYYIIADDEDDPHSSVASLGADTKVLSDIGNCWGSLCQRHGIHGVLARPDQHIVATFSSAEDIRNRFYDYIKPVER
eukprot:CAMPEP_0184021864 /NCGR_PEP_ID=MMETSP0954-20121128/10200_1 /TAXON_ID=627963 /ORGANISM="Aplanochytrium sp, Strain PBS07" /LENGTH=647 /DNA_ID=CAMNT_0026304001 /DNA_START=290 /DNA_END=2233 /DNA_ORIENTATION=-